MQAPLASATTPTGQAAAGSGGTLAVNGRQLERLDRGVVAVPAQSGGTLVSWRLLADDPAGTAFAIYRDGQRITAQPLTGATIFVDGSGGAGARYSVAAITGGREGQQSAPAPVLAEGYLNVPLQLPDGGTTPTGEAYTYTANDASVGDLDGDGRYELIVKWYPSNAKDNAQSGYTGPTLLDAYTLDGTRLWRIDLGRNIRSGAHYTQFMVADFDGDGRSELAVKTADGTVDGTGTVIGDASADWRAGDATVASADRTGSETAADGSRVARTTGRILSGPEYLTVFDGPTGRALASVPFEPRRHPETDNPTPEQAEATWGDKYGNRSDRMLAGVAWLDGQRPSIIMARGYYTRTTVAAFDFRDGQLMKRWLFDSTVPGNERFGGQGNHQLSVADVDGDGRDEIIYGAMALDDNGAGLWSSGMGHGDAMHVSDLDPTRPGLEKFGVHENMRASGNRGAAMMDARTGEVLWSTPAQEDTGRGIAADIDPRHPGAESWASNSPSLYNAKGEAIGSAKPRAANFAIWWDGDATRELLDGTVITKWDWQAASESTLLQPADVASGNGTKKNPALSADILGDWREELIVRTEDSRALRIYTTPYSTEHRLVTLMHDPVYRAAVAWQNTAYNQPPHPGFDLAGKVAGK
uniref:rhamnogalacturonan lyase n=1 Tax=Croceibacterium mercuriale TaxID=1572751 RepID=UPI0009DF3320|nr:rhamnogalacturonan lyase [Croceibacterium mercuriale]